MKTAAHQYEDKLLEFAYGELARPEADAVEAHVRGCQRCAQALDEIRGVRATMAQLPMVAAPDAGLDSLLAYAEQAAKRNAVADKPATSPWGRFLAPLVTVLTLVTVGVVGFRAKDEFDTSPANAAADAKLEKMAEEKSKAPAPVVAVAPNPPTDMPVAAAPQPQPHPAPKADEQAAAGDSDGNLDAKLAKQPEPESSELSFNTKGGKSAPQSITRRAAPNKDVAADDLSAAQLGGVAKNEAKPDLDTRKFDNNDSMNAGAGFRKEEAKRDAAKALETTKAPPPPPPAKETVAAKKSPQKPQLAPKDAVEVKEGWTQPSPSLADKTAPAPAPQEKPAPGPAFGLGTGGASTGSAPVVTEAESESTLRSGKTQNRQETERRRAEDEAQKKEVVSKQVLDRQPQRENAAPPPTVATVAPSSPPAQQPAPTTVASSDGKKKSKESYSLGPLAGSTSAPGGRGAPANQEQGAEEDALSIRPSANARADNDDANKMATQRAQFSGDAIESARLAANRGDRRGEIQFALRALQAGATGSTRAEALSRVCEAYEALGESSGDTYCNQLLKEFPTTAAAQRVADRRNAYRVSPKKAAQPSSKERQKAYDLESLDEKSPKPADAAPAQSY